MLALILDALWFVITCAGGSLVVFNFRGLADRIYRLFVRYSIGGGGALSPNLVRLIAGGLLFIATTILTVMLVEQIFPSSAIHHVGG